MSLTRQLFVILVLAALGGGGWWHFQSQASGGAGDAAGGARRGGGATLVEASPARLGVVAQEIETVGTLLARQSVEITSKASGQVEAVLFEAGRRVAAGDPLVRLDAAIERANLAEAKALRDDAKGQFERARQLVASRAVTEARLDELRAALAVAEARVEAAETRLADRVVRAPFAGVVGLAEVDVGARVNDDKVLTRLDDTAVVDLEARIMEPFFGLIRRGQPATATGAAFPGETFRGEVAAIDTRVDPVARSFRVRVALPNPDGRLVPGLFMVGRITVDERADAVLVPEEAVVPEGRQTIVFRVRDGIAERVSVTLGQRRVGEVEVLEGLSAGDLVVTAGVQRVRDGRPVEVRKPAPPPVSQGPGLSGKSAG